MEKQYSVQFFTSFVENLQRLCQNYINYDQMVEVSGYISVEIDNAKKERYVLSELVQSTGNVISESYCTKVFKNCPLPVQRSPGGPRREPPVMSQVSTPGKRPPLTQTSPNLNRMGRSPQMSRQMSPSGNMRPNNDNQSFSQRPVSFNQRLNQSSNFSPGRGAPPRMSSNFSSSGPGRGGMPPAQRFSSSGSNPVGRPPLAGNPRMMNSQRMNQQGRGGMQRSDVQRMGPNSIQARRSFGPGKGNAPQSKSPVDDPDELEVISFVPPPRRSVGEASTSSMSSGTRSPLTPETSSTTGNRPQFPSSSNRSNTSSSSMQPNSQGHSSSQSAMPVSLVQNVAQPSAPQMSRNMSHQMGSSQSHQMGSQSQQMSSQSHQTSSMQQNQSQNMSHSQMPQVSQASDSRQQMSHPGYQNPNMPQTSQPSDSGSQHNQPTRQQIVQQMIAARANRNLQIPPSLQQLAPTTQSHQGSQPMQQQQQQGSQSMSSQPVTSKPSSTAPQQGYPNMSQGQIGFQSPETPPGQALANPLQDPTRNIWDEMTDAGNFPKSADKKSTGILGSLDLPSLEGSVDSSGPMEITARNSSYMNTVGDRTSIASSSSAPSSSVPASGHISFPDDPLGSLQISNVVSLPTDQLPDLNPVVPGNIATSQASFADLSSTNTTNIIAEAFASLDSVTLQDAAEAMDPVTSESNSMTADNPMEAVPAKRQKMDSEAGEGGGPTSTNPKLMVPIGRKIKEMAKKRAKRGRPPKTEKPEKEGSEEEDEEAGQEFEADVSVDPSNRTLRTRRNPLPRIYNESSDSENSLQESFGLNFESTVTTSAGLVLAEQGEATEDDGKDSGGGAGSDTAPCHLDLNTGSEQMAHHVGTPDSRKSPDILTEADNESYVIIELESDDDDDSPLGAADSSTPVVKQELSTFTKPVQFAINRLTQFMILKKVKEPAYSIVPETLDPLLAEFYLRLRKSDGEEFIASSLKQIQNCIATYLSTNGYPFCIKSDPKFEKSQTTMENKLTHLRSREDAIFTVRPEDVDKLFAVGQLGSNTASALINTLWLMNTIHFSIRRPREHITLKWGDVKLGRENHQEHIEHLPSGKIVWRNQDRPERCFVTLYKKYSKLRPGSAQNPTAPFYLAGTDKNDRFRLQKYGDKMMASIFKRMLSAAGLPPAMKISNLDIL